jgi:hypothetical protein
MAEAGVDDRPAAMPACVQERPRDSIVAAHDDDRPVGDVERREVTGVGDVDRQRDHQRAAAKRGLDLTRETLGVAVLVSGDSEHRFRPVAALGGDVGEHPPAQVGQRHSSHGLLLWVCEEL